VYIKKNKMFLRIYQIQNSSHLIATHNSIFEMTLNVHRNNALGTDLNILQKDQIDKFKQSLSKIKVPHFGNQKLFINCKTPFRNLYF